MPLTVLSVAYPFAPVGPDAVGGAEQVLAALDAALIAAGHRSIVIAAAGSQVAGELMALPPIGGLLDDDAVARGRRAAADQITAVLRSRRIDLVHLHGVDFDHYRPAGPPNNPPVVATLHLPLAWYAEAALMPRPGTHLVCVSASQRATRPDLAGRLAVIENGVAVDRFAPGRRRCGYALMLARICPEKGVHLALDAARRADMPLLIAGETFPYTAHRRYFDEEVRPRLDARRRFLGPVGFARKRRLLAAARCLLVPSLAPETSSLVAREALAAGTPVVGFATGALAEAIDEGITGFLVDDDAAMADAIRRCDALDRAACRVVAERRFALATMTDAYLSLYRRLAGIEAQPGAAA
ncbi:D-inositol 3-phosphate glycosyltransferase [Rhodoplanes serenus]|uniref:D-inositol 3-phosphate glycosyltransferase n=1 Tax=Rhodoplanes serenus TaxID=200615 RepID=A0A447CVS0_9BRAD|nr:glycosyltransferase [Rhodoplanes serenus]VCU09442.1 D-inositol 3-phosphate glycosyltransferase [Rhodoplanes serenus]